VFLLRKTVHVVGPLSRPGAAQRSEKFVEATLPLRAVKGLFQGGVSIPVGNQPVELVLRGDCLLKGSQAVAEHRCQRVLHPALAQLGSLVAHCLLLGQSRNGRKDGLECLVGSFVLLL